MGTPFSKKPSPPLNSAAAAGGSSSGGGLSSRIIRGSIRRSSSTTDITSISNSSRMEYIRELSSYESDCQQDPELQNFDETLQQRTIEAISILTGSEMSTISFETLSQITGCLLDNSQLVVKMILDCKKDIWKNPEIKDLVEEYFENSLETLDFCTALDRCLKRARDSQLIIQVALKRFEEEDQSEEEEGKERYTRTLEELQHFKAAGNPFTEDFFQAFQSIYRHQVSMLERLKLKKKKLDKKLKSVKAWRRVSSIIFVSAFTAVVICSIVTAVMAAPAVAAALAAAAAIPLGSVGKWVDSLWKGYSDLLKGQRDVLSTMQVGTVVAISDLDGIRVLVDRLEIHISSLVQNADFALRDEEAVKFGIEEIKKKLGEFMKGVEDLGKQVDRCGRDIQRARTVVLQRIIKHPK